MGRHSASDDEVAVPFERESPFAKLLAPQYHSHAAIPVEDEQETIRLPDVGDIAAVPAPAVPEVTDRDARTAPVVPAAPAEPAGPDVPLEPVGEAATVEAPAAEDGQASGAPGGQSYSGTRGDLQLLRESSVLRLRCAAAVVVPFLVYTVLLIVIGRTDVYLIWFWIPTVLAGVLIGAFLDSAHRGRVRRRAQASDSGG